MRCRGVVVGRLLCLLPAPRSLQPACARRRLALAALGEDRLSAGRGRAVSQLWRPGAGGMGAAGQAGGLEGLLAS